jgi:hypothetical protein
MSDPKKLTVGEYLFSHCSESLLKEMAADSDYWASCDAFVNSNRMRHVGDLTYKQRDYLIRIKESLIEEMKKEGEYGS